jgi:hypothetical protein
MNVFEESTTTYEKCPRGRKRRMDGSRSFNPPVTSFLSVPERIAAVFLKHVPVAITRGFRFGEL